MDQRIEVMLRRQRMSIIDYLLNLNQEQLIDICIETVHKSPSERRYFHSSTISASDHFIIAYSTQNVSFFKELTRKHGVDLHKRLCAKMIMEKLSKNQIVFSKGDIGTKFYIILKGRVGILLPFLQADQRTTQYEEVNQLGPGNFFGELALLTNNPRGATVKCLEESIFGVIEKNTFNSILYKIQAKDVRKQTMFLQQISLFSNFTKQTLRTLIYHFKVHTFSKGQVVFSENEIADCFYLIKSGEVNLCKFFQTADTQQSDLYMASRSRRKFMVQIASEPQIAVLGANEIIGEIECIQGEKRHCSAIVASVGAQLYSIRAEDFLKRVVQHNKNAEVSEFLDKYIKDKIEWRNQRIVQILNTIYIEKQQARVVTSNSNTTQEMSNRIAYYRRGNLGEVYDNQALEYIVSKKERVMKQHSCTSEEPLSLISQYSRSPYLTKILNSQIENSNRKILSENEGTHICNRSTPLSTPYKRTGSRHIPIQSPSDSAPKNSYWNRRQMSPASGFQQVQFKVTSVDSTLSFVSNVKQETSPEKQFYTRLINKSKLKGSWNKKKYQVLTLTEPKIKELHLNLSKEDLKAPPRKRRNRTIS